MADPEPRFRSAPEAPSVSWPVAVVLAVGAFALGGVTPGTTLVLAAAVAGIATWAILVGAFKMSRLAWLLLALLAITLLQTVPLPLGWIAQVSPDGAAVWRETRELLGAPANLVPLSLEPQATRLEALRLATFAVFAGLCHHGVRKHGSSATCTAVALVATLVALATIGHQVLEAERVFGWYRPEYSNFIAPLMNTNTLSGLLGLGLFSAAGLLVDRRSPEALRFVSLFACLICSATIVWLGSRAGVALLVVGLPAFSAWVWWRGRRELDDDSRRRLLWLGAAQLLGFGFAAFSLVRLRRELLDESLDKLAVISPAIAALRNYWLGGAGRGAFAVAVAPFVETGEARFENAEIFPLWFAVEWGVPVAILLLVALGRWFWRSLRQLSPSRFGAYLGLGLLWIHNLADFSLEVPLVALSAIAAFEAAGTREVGRGGERAPRTLLLVALAGLFASVASFPVELGRATRARLAAALSEGPVPRRWVDDAVRAHPADAFLLRLEGAAALARRDPTTLRWIGLALERAPGSGASLLLLSDALVQRGRSQQALSALRRAAVLEPTLSDEVARRAFAISAENPEAVVPEGPLGMHVSRALLRLSTNPLQRLELARLAVERAPGSRDAELDLLALLAVSPETACAAVFSQRCGTVFAERRGRLGEARMPRLIELDAEVLVREGRPDEAFRLLGERCPRAPEALSCLLSWMQYGAKQPLADQLAAIDVYLGIACTEAAQCADAEERAGGELLARGELRLAATHFGKTARLGPTVARWVQVARVARDTGDLAMLEGALDEVTRLGATPPSDLRDSAQQLRRSRLAPND